MVKLAHGRTWKKAEDPVAPFSRPSSANLSLTDCVVDLNYGLGLLLLREPNFPRPRTAQPIEDTVNYSIRKRGLLHHVRGPTSTTVGLNLQNIVNRLNYCVTDWFLQKRDYFSLAREHYEIGKATSLVCQRNQRGRAHKWAIGSTRASASWLFCDSDGPRFTSFGIRHYCKRVVHHS